MAVNAEIIYKDRDAVIAELVAALQARIPDASMPPDSIWRIWIETMASTVEGLFLAWQLLHNDMFIQTAQGLALLRYGEMYGRPLKSGTKAIGTARVSGAGGTVVNVGTQLAAPQAADEALTFSVTTGGTIPNPGIPTAPVVADAGAGGALAAGTYRVAYTFLTAEGETALGEPSTPLVLAGSHSINITSVPLGGPGTTARRQYRSVDGGPWLQNTDAADVAAINNNTTTTYNDNSTTLGGSPPLSSTAERLTISLEADDVGVEYNIGIGTLTEFATALPGLTEVTNLAAFAGGSDEEDIETFRSKLLEWVRAPKSGSPLDLKVWAEAIAGVETATVFENDNLGVTTPGHATVRISGPNGSVPSAATIDAVLADLDSRDLASITIHVATFTPLAVNVSVTVTRQTGYLLSDITAGVQAAINDYINSLPVGGTVYREGIAHAVFPLAGVATLVVNTPATDTSVTVTQKAVPGTVTVA